MRVHLLLTAAIDGKTTLFYLSGSHKIKGNNHELYAIFHGIYSHGQISKSWGLKEYSAKELQQRMANDWSIYSAPACEMLVGLIIMIFTILATPIELFYYPIWVTSISLWLPISVFWNMRNVNCDIPNSAAVDSSKNTSSNGIACIGLKLFVYYLEFGWLL